MKTITQTLAISLSIFISACQPNVATPTVTAPNATPAPIVTPAATANKQETKIEDIRSQVKFKNYGFALDSINELINHQPANADAFYLRASIQSAIGDYSAASISLDQSLQAGLSNPQQILTDTALIEFRKSSSFKQLQTKYSALTARNDKSVAKMPNDDAMEVKAGNITLRLPNN